MLQYSLISISAVFKAKNRDGRISKNFEKACGNRILDEPTDRKTKLL